MGVPESIQTMVVNERNIALRQSLRLLPNYDEAMIMMNDAMAAVAVILVRHEITRIATNRHRWDNDPQC